MEDTVLHNTSVWSNFEEEKYEKINNETYIGK